MTKACIAIVSETYRPEVNGVANTLSYLVDGLKEKGYHIQVIRPRQNASDNSIVMDDERHLTTTGLPIPKYPELKFGLPSPGRIRAMWKMQRPQAVYIATEGPLGWSANKVAVKMGIPVLSGFHTNFQSYSRFYGLAWLEKLVMAYLRHFHNLTRGTLVPTKDQASLLERSGFKNVSVLSRGVDATLFNPNKRDAGLRETWLEGSEGIVCLYVGRLAHEKNVQLIGKAYQRLSGKNQDIKFVFVGDGPARGELEKLCPNAVFAGMRRGEDLAAHYASADIFLFPSQTDTFGNVVTEAMASELSIVAFDDAAAKEHLCHGDSAFLSQLNDEESYLENIEQACLNSEQRNQTRAKALKIAQSISWQRIVTQFEQALLGSVKSRVSAPAANEKSMHMSLSKRNI